MRRNLAPFAAALRCAATWRSGFLRRVSFVVAPVFAVPARLGLKVFSRPVKGRWMPWLIGPAIGLSFGALGFEGHDVWRTLRSGPVSAPTMERVADSPSAGEKELSNAQDVGAIDESPQENARMSDWKRAVEAALKDAGPQQGEGANGARATGNTESKPSQEEGTAKAQAAQKQEADAGQDTGKEVNPFASSPLIDLHGLGRNAGPNVVPFVRPEAPPFWRMRAQVRGRHHWRGWHFGGFRFYFR
jgi:hypothetical protein